MKIGDFESIGDFIKSAIKECDDAPEKEKIASETKDDKQNQDQFEPSLEKVAKFIDALVEIDFSKEADAKGILAGLKKLFTSPRFWLPAAVVGAGAGGVAVGKKMHKGKAEKHLYDVAQRYYSLGTEDAATAISEMLTQKYYEPPVGPAGVLKKVSSYVREQSKELEAYRKKEEATKIANSMINKGLIPEKQLFDKVAELEKEENLEIVKKAIEMTSAGALNFGKVANDEDSSVKGGMYDVLTSI